MVAMGAITMLRVSSFIIVAPLSGQRGCLLSHGITGAMDRVPGGLGQLLEAHRGRFAPIHDIDLETQGHLVDRGYLTVLSREEEANFLRRIAERLRTRGLSAKVPSISFVPTYQCNLRCFYCFQPHRAHAGHGKFAAVMTDEQVRDAFAIVDKFAFPGALAAEIDRTLASPYRRVSGRTPHYREIGLFGGEPLTPTTGQVVRTIATHARERGATLWAISNGTELHRFEDILGTEPGQLSEIQVTLDGTSNTHDVRRRGPRLLETFTQITENIELCLHHGVQINIRMNTDEAVVTEIAPLARYFQERGWDRLDRFSFACAAVTSPGRTPSPSWGELVDHTAQARSAGLNVESYEHFARDFLANCLSASPGEFPHKKTANCAAEEGQLMFDCMGDVYGCWEDVSFAEHRIGTYGRDGLSLDVEAVRTWFGRHPGTLEECSACPYALIHTSGCAAQARESAGTILKNDCAGFQSYFPRSLAREYEEFESRILQSKMSEVENA